MPTKEQHTMLANKLEFLRTHRGTLRGDCDAQLVESTRPEFTFLIPGERAPRPELFDRFATIYRAPWAAGTSPEVLVAHGYEKEAAISLMAFDGSTASWHKPAREFSAAVVRDAVGMEIFSETQSRGFCEKEAVYAEWYPWLRAANFKNLGNENQYFYIGSIEGKAVAVCLMVFTQDHVGIYSVTTLPSARKTGASTALMAHAIAQANTERGFPSSRVTLQVAADSYAEGFYERLGFKTRYQLEVFKRPS